MLATYEYLGSTNLRGCSLGMISMEIRLGIILVRLYQFQVMEIDLQSELRKMMPVETMLAMFTYSTTISYYHPGFKLPQVLKGQIVAAWLVIQSL